MKRIAYILCFDRDDSINYQEFHEKLGNLPEVLTWFHYIKSSYILISEVLSATKLNAEIIKLLPDPTGKSILLVEINLANRNGLLPQAAWDWLKKEQKKITSSSTN